MEEKKQQMKEDFEKIKKAKKTIKLFDPPVAQKRDLRDVLNEESKSEMVQISTFADAARPNLIIKSPQVVSKDPILIDPS
jgi:hypothetical protein